MKNWRTSLAGAGTLVYAVADLIVQFHNAEWDATRLGTDAMVIFTGLGLIAARDATASTQEHAEDRERIRENVQAIEQINAGK